MKLSSALGSAALLFSGAPEEGARDFPLKPNRKRSVSVSSNGRHQSTLLPVLRYLTDRDLNDMKDKEKQTVKTLCNITDERHQCPRHDVLVKSLLFHYYHYY